DVGARHQTEVRTLHLQRDLEQPRGLVDPPEAGVVARVLVLGARIAQAGDEFDHGSGFSQKKRPARGGPSGGQKQGPAPCHPKPERAPMGAANRDVVERACPDYFLPLPFFLSSAGAAATGAATTSSTGSTTVATVMSLRPCDTSFTPLGSWMSAPCTVAPLVTWLRSTVMCSGSWVARHSISMSVTTWLTRHLSSLTAGDSSAPTKCSGTFLRRRVLSSTRWKSTCRTMGLKGWYCTSRSSTFSTLPPSSMSRMEAWKASFFRACHRAL